jgi:hypothetical protein
MEKSKEWTLVRKWSSDRRPGQIDKKKRTCAIVPYVAKKSPVARDECQKYSFNKSETVVAFGVHDGFLLTK